MGWSCAFPDGTSYYIPLNHRKGNASYQQGVDALGVALQQSEVWIHNLKHELKAFQRVEGLRTRDGKGLLDSQVACWLAGINAGGKFGLKELALKHLDYAMATFDDTVGEGQFGLLDPEEGKDYACDDAIAALLLGRKAQQTIGSYGLTEWFHQVELPFVRVLRDCQDTGVSIDPARIHALRVEWESERERLLGDFQRLTDIENPGSSKQLQEMFERGWWDPDIAPKTATGAYKTGADVVKAQLATLPKGSKGYEAARLLSEFKVYHKLIGTYTTSLIELAAQYPDGKLHPDYHQTGTATGRLSSSYPNGQQMPVRTEQGRRLLECFAAPMDEWWGSADFSQIELRVLAHYCGGALGEAYRLGKDVHQQTADLTGSSRTHAKTINFAKIYGAHHKKMASTLGVTVDEAKGFMEMYDKAYPEVEQTMRQVRTAAYRRGYVKTLSGRRRYLPEMPNRNRSWVDQGFVSVNKGLMSMDELMDAWGDERKAFNTVCQGSAADITKKAMVDLHQQMPGWMRPQTQIHDDIRWTISIPEPEKTSQKLRAGESMAMVQRVMENAWPGLRVPLVAEPVVGRNWKELK